MLSKMWNDYQLQYVTTWQVTYTQMWHSGRLTNFVTNSLANGFLHLLSSNILVPIYLFFFSLNAVGQTNFMTLKVLNTVTTFSKYKLVVTVLINASMRNISYNTMDFIQIVKFTLQFYWENCKLKVATFIKSLILLQVYVLTTKFYQVQ